MRFARLPMTRGNPTCVEVQTHWHLVSTDDKMILRDVQRAIPKRVGCKVVGAKRIGAVYLPQPETVASLIDQVVTNTY